MRGCYEYEYDDFCLVTFLTSFFYFIGVGGSLFSSVPLFLFLSFILSFFLFFLPSCLTEIILIFFVIISFLVLVAICMYANCLIKLDLFLFSETYVEVQLVVGFLCKCTLIFKKLYSITVSVIHLFVCIVCVQNISSVFLPLFFVSFPLSCSPKRLVFHCSQPCRRCTNILVFMFKQI